MTTGNLFNLFSFLLFLTCLACVPLQQQINESEDSEIEGFVGPLIIDQENFYRIASSTVSDGLTHDEQLLLAKGNVTYEGTFDGKTVHIRHCKCLDDVKIIQNKLVVTHSYGGGESNRESTILLWNGKYYQNLKGEYIVDLILYSSKIDFRRALLREKKVLDLAAVQVNNANFVWLNLVGYNQLIKYTY